MADETIVESLLAQRGRDPDHSLFYQPDGVATSYREGVARIMAVVEWLEGLGLRRGEVVPCYLDDQIPSLYFTLACAVAGLVPVPLSPVFSTNYFLQAIVRRLDAATVFTTERHVSTLTGRGVRVLCFGDLSREEGDVFTLGDERVDGDKAIELLADRTCAVHLDDVFMIQPTAGSTGEPKLVRRRHRAFARYAHFVGDEIALHESEAPERLLMVAALTHAFGLHMLTTSLRLGASMAIPTALDTAVSLVEVRSLDPTILPLLPRVQRALYRQAGKLPGQERILGPSARVICSAGGAPDREILESFQREGAQIVEFYGSSEASIVAVTPRGGWCPPFAGRVVADARVNVMADGELLVSSPGVTDGYVRDDPATREAFEGDYYRTGDLVEIRPDGYLRVVGRKCDVFNTPEGSNIHPRRIEEMIEGLPAVEQVVLVGDQRPFIAAFIVLSPALRPAQPPGSETVLLDPLAHARLYALAGAHIAEINRRLEQIEQVVRIALLSGRLPDDIYSVVCAGKVRRDRLALGRRYGDIIEGVLYAEPDTAAPVQVQHGPPGPPVDPGAVPPKDRRTDRRRNWSVQPAVPGGDLARKERQRQ